MKLFTFVDEHLLQAFGWTLIHSLWQIALIGLLLRAGLWLLRKKTAVFRYYLFLAGIACILAVTGYTFYLLDRQPVDATASEFSTQAFSNTNPEIIPGNFITPQITEPNKNLPGKLQDFIYQNIQLITLIWLMGFIIFSVRFAGGYWYLSRLRKKFTVPVSENIQKLSDEIRERLRLDKIVNVLESASIKIPIALGYLKPVIILPVGLATSIPFDQVEAILTHELAHIKRNDYLMNLLKSVLEAVFFYHPVFWWISRSIEFERELCCDEVTVAACENDKSLKEALLNVELYNQKLQHIAAALYKNKFQLLNRIKHMKTKNHTNHNKRSVNGLMILPVVVIIFALASAFVPRQGDMTDLSVHNNPALPANVTTADMMPVTIGNFPASKNETEPVEDNTEIATPDTTIVKSGNEKKKSDGKILMEYDENMNLKSVTKDGKELTGEEREKYERLAEKSRQAYEEDLNRKEREQAMAELKDRLHEVQQKMKDVQKEYSEALNSYLKAAKANKLEDWEMAWPDTLSWVNPQVLALTQLENLAPLTEYYPSPDLENLQGIDEEKLRDEIEKSTDAYKDALKKYQYQYQYHQNNPAPDYDEFFKDYSGHNKYRDLFDENMGSLKNSIKKELLNDNLIGSWDDFKSFSITPKRMEVNGEKQSKEMLEKYLKLYKDVTGEELKGDFDFDEEN